MSLSSHKVGTESIPIEPELVDTSGGSATVKRLFADRLFHPVFPLPAPSGSVSVLRRQETGTREEAAPSGSVSVLRRQETGTREEAAPSGSVSALCRQETGTREEAAP